MVLFSTFSININNTKLRNLNVLIFNGFKRIIKHDLTNIINYCLITLIEK